MAISTVTGYPRGATSINGVTPSAQLVNLLANDYVFIFGCHGEKGRSAGPLAAYGYSQLGTEVQATYGTTSDVRGGVWYKKMGATPDTNVDLLPPTSATLAAAYVVWGLRGVDGTNPIEKDVTPATGTSGDPDPPSITTTSGASWIFCCGMSSRSITSGNCAAAPPSGFSAGVDYWGNDTDDVAVAVALRQSTEAETINPAAWAAFASAAWIGRTIAVKPSGEEPPPEPTTATASTGRFALIGYTSLLGLDIKSTTGKTLFRGHSVNPILDILGGGSGKVGFDGHIPGASIDILATKGILSLSGRSPKAELGITVQSGILSFKGDQPAPTLDVTLSNGDMSFLGHTIPYMIDIPLTSGRTPLRGHTSGIELEIPIEGGLVSLRGDTIELDIVEPEPEYELTTGLLSFKGQSPNIDLSLLSRTGALGLRGSAPGADLALLVADSGKINLRGHPISHQSDFTMGGTGTLLLSGLQPNVGLSIQLLDGRFGLGGLEQKVELDITTQSGSLSITGYALYDADAGLPLAGAGVISLVGGTPGLELDILTTLRDVTIRGYQPSEVLDITWTVGKISTEGRTPEIQSEFILNTGAISFVGSVLGADISILPNQDLLYETDDPVTLTRRLTFTGNLAKTIIDTLLGTPVTRINFSGSDTLTVNTAEDRWERLASEISSYTDEADYDSDWTKIPSDFD